MPPTDVFPSFPGFPLELRLKIWREALLVPSVWVAVVDGDADALKDTDNRNPLPINMGFIGSAAPLGKRVNGLEQFAYPNGPCLLPARGGNGDGSERCERASDAAARW
ncbi:hypothetical protein CH63R_10674 [Colletotrichum higginsianum IMI 349063]|uniref:2EXR domain-containing protein n=1 Tax=Colletotrichum higginsianum (strain IMI 349063) TaxID=759273 RepID=A0A1B7Y3I1_COLHI|nr:uncharacterized protein CH63R_10674 [Colletotrichum higginsianum IMI 349063]OBR06554.1 hypothetical protein CH63R_10674 [Colletotrichum higginsianum IMI 349063]